MIDENETRFLNVDLDILSPAPLEPLVAALGKIFVHDVGREGKRYGAHVALTNHGQSADALTRALVRRVDRLPPVAKKLWKGADSRVFNVGIQAGLEPHNHETLLTSETLRMVARVGGAITITTYAPLLRAEVAARETGAPDHPTQPKRIRVRRRSRRS